MARFRREATGRNCRHRRIAEIANEYSATRTNNISSPGFSVISMRHDDILAGANAQQRAWMGLPDECAACDHWQSSAPNLGLFPKDIDMGEGQYRVRSSGGLPDYARVHYGTAGKKDVDEAEYRSKGFAPPFDELEWRGRGGVLLDLEGGATEGKAP
jgi:hypothetical protein